VSSGDHAMVGCSSDKHVVSNPLHANEVLRSRDNGTVSGNHVANPLAYNHRNPICKDILMISAEPRGGHPLRLLNEIVAPHSANDGEVEFVIPDNVSTVGLQMGDVGEGKPTLYLDLQHPNP